MALVFLGIGTNLGDKEDNLNRAILLIQTRIGEVQNVSSFYRSSPWGFSSENSFLNGVLLIDTSFSPSELLEKLKKIEVKMGRIAKTDDKYTDRVIDIDILFYENRRVSERHLTIPHPHIAQRGFVLIPLAEIAPDLIHPVLQKSILQLKDEWTKANDQSDYSVTSE